MSRNHDSFSNRFVAIHQRKIACVCIASHWKSIVIQVWVWKAAHKELIALRFSVIIYRAILVFHAFSLWLVVSVPLWKQHITWQKLSEGDCGWKWRSDRVRWNALGFRVKEFILLLLQTKVWLISSKIRLCIVFLKAPPHVFVAYHLKSEIASKLAKNLRLIFLR